MKNRGLLTQKVARAQEKLEIAERELSIALEKLKVPIGGDNVMVTNVILKAFERVKDGKRDVAELKQLLESSDVE